MLKIKNCTAKNFMSIGNTTQAVNFDDCQLTLVLGNNLDLGGDGSRNGTGKTTIINALSYALYGEALTNIRRDNLINKSNGKNMLVTVEFSIDGVEYHIERGRRPQVLKFTDSSKDSFPVTTKEKSAHEGEQQGDSRETQREIEKILGFPHNMFKHLIALNTYSEPFLSMKTKDQCDMIEQLLGITDLSAKAEILKDLLKGTKTSIKEEEFKMGTLKDNNERIEQNIRDLERKSKMWDRTNEDKITEIGGTIIDLEEIDINVELARIKRNAEKDTLRETKKALIAQWQQVDSTVAKCESRLEDLNRQVSAAGEGKCPACGQDTAHLDTHEDYTAKIYSKLRAEEKDKETAIEASNKLQEAIDKVRDAGEPEKTFYKTLEEALAHKHNLDTLTVKLSEVANEHNPYKEQVINLQDTAIQEIDFELINDLVSKRDHQDFLYRLLTSKDSFIRKKIIDQNIAYLNHRLSHYLKKIGLPHDVQFSNELNVEITEYGRELDFDNLSKGERIRVILSLSWAFRDIYESLNRPMNLLCIDELIDSGLDTTGVEAALGMLKDMNRVQGKNILLISHREELISRVNRVLMVTKEGGYTSYANAEEDI